MIGTGVGGAAVDTLLGSIDSEIQKLFEDRNAIMTDGGVISLSTNGQTLSFTEDVNLVLNSTAAGGNAISLNLGSGNVASLLTGYLWYAVVNRTAPSVTTNIASGTIGLPATTYANQEVFLLAVRLDSADGTKTVYLRGGTTIVAGQSVRLGSSSGLDNFFSIGNASDPTKQIKFSTGSAVTGTTLTLASQALVNQTFFFPQTSGTDYLVSNTSTSLLTNKTLGFLQTSSLTDPTVYGADATLQAADITVGFVSLTGVTGTTSIAAIPAGAAGQVLTVENQTANTITVINNYGGANKPIYTGTGGTVTMTPYSSLTFIYNTALSAWSITGGITGSVYAVGAFGSTPNANGASILNGVLTLQPASNTQPGGISTTTQSFLGDKTFFGTVEIVVGGNASIFTVNSVNVTGISTNALQLGGTGEAKIATLGPTTMAIQNPGSGSYTTIVGGPVNQTQPLVTIRGTINLVYTNTGATDAGASTVHGTGFTIHSGLFNYTALGIAFDVPFASQPTIVCTIQVLSPSTPASQNNDLYYTSSGTLGGTTDAAYGGVNGFLTAVFGAGSNVYVIDFIAIGPAAY